MTEEQRGALHSHRAEPRWRAPVARAVTIATFAAFLAYYGLLCFRHVGWGGDLQMYCAGIAQLYRDYWHPSHEAMDAPGWQSTVYTPYLVAIAGLGKLSGATPYRVLQVAGVANLLFFSASVLYLYSRHSLHRRWWLAAACFIWATLLLRWLQYGWSSEISLTNFQFIQPFPSTFGWALAFVAYGLMVDLSRQQRALELILLGLALGLLLSSHVLTGSWAIGLVGLHALWVSARERRWLLLLRPMLAIAMSVALTAAWPYARFLEQRSMSNINEGSPFGGSPVHDFTTLYALAVPCYAYTLARFRRHAYWLAGVLATLGVLFVWRHVGFTFGNRYAFFAAFCAHFIVAEVMALGVFALAGRLVELPAERRWRWLDRPFSALVLCLALVAWLPSPMFHRAFYEPHFGRLYSPAELLRQPSPHDAYEAQFGSIRGFLSNRDLVLTPISRSVLDLAALTGVHVVCSPNAFQVPDYMRRRWEVNRFFDRRSNRNERARIVQRRHPSKLLLPHSHFSLLRPLTQQFGAPRYQGSDYVLWNLET